VGRVEFLKYVWNHQQSLQAEGDAGCVPAHCETSCWLPLLLARYPAGQVLFQSGALILHSRVERSLKGIREAAARGKAMRESASSAAAGAAVPAN
jgi:hypothetical protein